MPQAMIMPKKYFFDKDGNPLAYGKIYTYQAGTTINKDTFTSEGGSVANTNPIILNGEGYGSVYLDGSYNIVVDDADDNNIWTEDPVSSIFAEEWINCKQASYLSPKSLSVNGNSTGQYYEGKKVRIDNGTANYSFSVVLSSSFAGGITTINIIDAFVEVSVVGVCVSIIPNTEDGGVVISETQTLASGQTVVSGFSIDLNHSEVHVSHPSIDSRQLVIKDDYQVSDPSEPSELTLTNSFPAGTKIVVSGLLGVTLTTSFTGDFPSDAALPEHAMSFDFSFSDEPLQGMQGVDIDIENNLVYISQNVKGGGVNSYDPDEMCQLAVYTYKTDKSLVVPITFTSQLDLGHGQDLSYENIGDNVYLYTSAKTPVDSDVSVTGYDGQTINITNPNAGRKIARIEYKGSLTANSDVVEFRLLDDFNALDETTWFYRCTPKISTDKKYIVAKATNMRGRYNPKIIVWDKSEVEIGNYENPLSEFFMPAFLTNNPDLNTVQSVHLHENIIYVQLGFTDPLSFKKIARFTLNGSLLDHYDFYADVSYLADTETTVEPEGMTFTVANGSLRMAMAFNTKTATENVKSLQIYGIGEAIEHKSEKISPATIALDDSQYDISYQEGEALQISSYDYNLNIMIPVLRVNASYNLDLQNGTDISIQGDRVLRKNDTGAGRETLLIRAKDTLTNGTGINLYGSGDSAFPDQISLFATQGVFYGDVSGEPPTPSSGGGVLFVQAGALKYKGSSGTVTTLGVA